MKQTKKIVALLLALSLMLGLPFVATAADAAKVVNVSARPDLPTITIDGTVSISEWGDPIGSYTASDCTNSSKVVDSTWWHRWDAAILPNGKTAGRPDGQKIEIYVRRDNTYVYVAAKLVNASKLDTTATDFTSLRNAAHLYFTIGTYDAVTAITQGNDNGTAYDQFVLYEMGLINGVKANQAKTIVGNVNALADENYAIAYEGTTYTYEARIPYSETLGYVNATDDLTMSFDITDAYGGNTDGDGTRHLTVSYAAWRYANNGWGTYKTNHAVTMPLHISFNGCYVNSKVAPMPATAPTLNGVIGAGEWGEPVIVTSPSHAGTVWTGGCWKADATDANQRAKVYVTNDENYIYLAATVDMEEPTKGWYVGSTSWMYPMMGFMVAAANADGTGIKQISYEGNTYDAFNSWTLRFDPEGNPVIANRSSQGTGGMNYAMKAEDAIAAYDEATKTYTYEVRIPYEITNIDRYNASKIAIAVHLSTSQDFGAGLEVDSKHTRYNIGGTAWASPSGKTPYTSAGSVVLAINDVKSYSEKLIEQLDSATEGSVITLLQPANLGDTPLVVKPGVTLDLNGKELTAKNVYAINGQIVDNVDYNTDDQGRLKIAKAGTDENSTIQLNPDNAFLPIYDTNAYIFKEITSTQLKLDKDSSVMLGHQFSVVNPKQGVYWLLKHATYNPDLKLISELEITVDGGKPIKLTYEFKKDNLNTYLSKVESGAEGNWAIVLEVFGFDQIDASEIVMTATPKLVNDTGVAMTFDTAATMTYTYTK